MSGLRLPYRAEEVITREIWEEHRFACMEASEGFSWEDRFAISKIVTNINHMFSDVSRLEVDVRRHPSTGNKLKVSNQQEKIIEAVRVLNQQLVLIKLYSI